MFVKTILNGEINEYNYVECFHYSYQITAWADFSKAPASGTAVAMDTSPWDQQAQNSSAAEAQSSTPESSSNAEEKWANFDQMFPTSTSPADSNNKKTVNLEGEQEPKKENWADFTNFEEMESSDNKVVSK